MHQPMFCAHLYPKAAGIVKYCFNQRFGRLTCVDPLHAVISSFSNCSLADRGRYSPRLTLPNDEMSRYASAIAITTIQYMNMAAL